MVEFLNAIGNLVFCSACSNSWNCALLSLRGLCVSDCRCCCDLVGSCLEIRKDKVPLELDRWITSVPHSYWTIRSSVSVLVKENFLWRYERWSFVEFIALNRCGWCEFLCDVAVIVVCTKVQWNCVQLFKQCRKSQKWRIETTIKSFLKPVWRFSKCSWFKTFVNLGNLTEFGGRMGLLPDDAGHHAGTTGMTITFMLMVILGNNWQV